MKDSMLSKFNSAINARPYITAIVVLASYFIMDAALLNVDRDAGWLSVTACLCVTLALFYACYAMQYQFGFQAATRKKKMSVVVMFAVLSIVSFIILFAYEDIVAGWFPNLNNIYYPSQVLLLVLIAPISEELVFRYLLYDKWTKTKFGVLRGILLTSILFVICHPVTNIESMVLYWIPALLFYLVYESFGLYGSILAHMVFNFIAL